MAFNRKGLSAGTSGTIAPLSDVEQNNLSGQHSQEKFTRWASEPPREGKAEAPNEGVAVTASDGNQVVLTVKDLRGGQGLPCLTAASPRQQSCLLLAQRKHPHSKSMCGHFQAESFPVDRACQR